MRTARALRKMHWVVAIFAWWMPTMVYCQEPTMAPTMSNNTLSPVSGDPEIPECFNSTTLLFQAMLRGSSFVAQTYIVCPNTRLQIGFFIGDGVCCENGEAPLILRSRSVVKCGETGESSNNCTLVGGQAHVFYIGAYYSETLAQDVRVEGFTFEATDFISTAIANRGDITFHDCIWKDNDNSGVLFVAYGGPDDDEDDTARRLLGSGGVDAGDSNTQNDSTKGFFEEWVTMKMQQALALQAMPTPPAHDPDEHARGLQVPFLMDVTFENCKFINNKQGPRAQGGIPLLGVINIITRFNPTTVRNCTFKGNVFDGSDGSQNGFAIQSLGADLTVERVCLIDNSFIGFGPIQAFDGARFTHENTFTTTDELSFCEFAAESDSAVPSSLADLQCIPKDRATCLGDEPIDIGTSTTVPTAAPSSGTTSTLRGGLLLLLGTGLCAYLPTILL